MTDTDPKAVAYIEPEHFSNGLCPVSHTRGWPGFLEGLELNEAYDGISHRYYFTCASQNGICSDRKCLISKGQIRFTHTRYDYNYCSNTWYEPQSFCLQCAPPYFLSMCGEIDTNHLPKDALSLVETVVKIARREPVFMKGYGDEGEASIEEMAKFLDEEQLHEYKEVKRAYDQRKANARANPRRLPERVLKYRCYDDSLLKPEPNGLSCYDEDANPFKRPDVNILKNWCRVEY